MPDNGFSSKERSADFLLRIYLVKPDWERAAGGTGKIEILKFISLSDPRRQVNFPIRNGGTQRRLLTGADLDIESMQHLPDGSFWIGDENGPFLIHVDARGEVLSPPVQSPFGRTSRNPLLGDKKPNLPVSGGIEAMAASTDGSYLYPILEKAVDDAPDPKLRTIAEFDTATGSYTAKTWNYQVDHRNDSVSDAQLLADGTLLVLERDSKQGAKATTKRVYALDFTDSAPGSTIPKTLVADLLKISNPDRLGAGDGWGTGDPFSFAQFSVETLVALDDGQLMIANDNNYPVDDSRKPGIPDPTEMIIIEPKAPR